jgi:hypothetical protein
MYWLRLSAVAGALLITAGAGSAAAQEFGARVGVSADPDQFYFGGHVETDPIVDRLRFRPNVEIGLGDDVTLVAFNFEFAYHFPARQAWNFYAGGGPALNLYDAEDDTDVEGGFNILLGVAHRNGLFVEFKVGLIDSPDVKFGVGFVFR